MQKFYNRMADTMDFFEIKRKEIDKKYYEI